MNKLTITIKRCARCGQDHENLIFEEFIDKPIDIDYNYWAMCPGMKQPILLKLYDDKGK